VSKNRVLRRTFACKRFEVAGDWRQLYNEELHSLHSTNCFRAYQIKQSDMGGACSTHGGDEKCAHILVGKSEVNSSVGAKGIIKRKNWIGFVWLRIAIGGGLL
jgi:hypothetical protein